MAQAPRPDTPRRRELGVWPLVIGAVIIILLAVLYFSWEVEPPPPLPDSPVAQGTVGQPTGTTGATPQPGAPPVVEQNTANPPAASN
ncbi:hypothetical protein GI374_12400 [Paracoccus sp. S-4012]|uniref:hypothetical protein n=1 Tax=Paracoccus sp. S-4012 TaxID=2665648 RepID=UPI0012AF46B3|nr:hypothetical protein [Paracoccus sp. S-4012]MRX51230.1 hypothetical protein [Paracoccus sp. S-4012]